jgi:hypothetical protein
VLSVLPCRIEKRRELRIFGDDRVRLEARGLEEHAEAGGPHRARHQRQAHDGAGVDRVELAHDLLHDLVGQRTELEHVRGRAVAGGRSEVTVMVGRSKASSFCLRLRRDQQTAGRCRCTAALAWNPAAVTA